MRGLLPDGRVRVAMVLHTAAVVVGVGAIASGWPLLAWAAGVLLGLTGVVLALNLVHTLAPRYTLDTR